MNTCTEILIFQNRKHEFITPPKTVHNKSVACFKYLAEEMTSQMISKVSLCRSIDSLKFSSHKADGHYTS